MVEVCLGIFGPQEKKSFEKITITAVIHLKRAAQEKFGGKLDLTNGERDE